MVVAAAHLSHGVASLPLDPHGRREPPRPRSPMAVAAAHLSHAYALAFVHCRRCAGCWSPTDAACPRSRVCVAATKSGHSVQPIGSSVLYKLRFSKNQNRSVPSKSRNRANLGSVSVITELTKKAVNASKRTMFLPYFHVDEDPNQIRSIM